MPALRGDVFVDGKRVTAPISICGMAFQNSDAAALAQRRSTTCCCRSKSSSRYAQDFRRRRHEYADRARALLRSVGLAGFEDKYPWELSGGMQQRASLCRALIHDPRLLLLDEPFGALDAFTREDLWEVLQELWIEKRPTVHPRDARPARGGVSGRHHLCDERAARGASCRAPRSNFRGRASLETTFEPDFIAKVHGLREKIASGTDVNGARSGA